MVNFGQISKLIAFMHMVITMKPTCFLMQLQRLLKAFIIIILVGMRVLSIMVMNG